MISGHKEILQYFIDKFIRPGMRVLDIGHGTDQVSMFIENGCDLVGISYYDHKNPPCEVINSNFLFYQPAFEYDAIWCSHTLEHITNINLFLRHMIDISVNSASFCIVVPVPNIQTLVGGHINLFTSGSLCYNIILSGQDLSDAIVIHYKSNIVVMWKRKDISLPILKYDQGDLEVLNQYFPKNVSQGIVAKCWNLRCEDFLFDIFDKEYVDICKPYEKDVGEFYLDTNRLWWRYYSILSHAKNSGFTKGLDFGVGSCSSLIICKLISGLTISGLDIIDIRRHKQENRFRNIQNIMLKNGCDIEYCDTGKYPWPYIDKCLDFIICCDSIFVDWDEFIDWKQYIDKYMNNSLDRIHEMIRILKPGGLIYIDGGSQYGTDINIFNEHVLQYVKNDKNIIFCDVQKLPNHFPNFLNPLHPAFSK